MQSSYPLRYQVLCKSDHFEKRHCGHLGFSTKNEISIKSLRTSRFHHIFRKVPMTRTACLKYDMAAILKNRRLSILNWDHIQGMQKPIVQTPCLYHLRSQRSGPEWTCVKYTPKKSHCGHFPEKLFKIRKIREGCWPLFTPTTPQYAYFEHSVKLTISKQSLRSPRRSSLTTILVLVPYKLPMYRYWQTWVENLFESLRKSMLSRPNVCLSFISEYTFHRK